ncbi:hypothetical protein AWENTII_004562 [Aspergillus wentii]
MPLLGPLTPPGDDMRSFLRSQKGLLGDDKCLGSSFRQPRKRHKRDLPTMRQTLLDSGPSIERGRGRLKNVVRNVVRIGSQSPVSPDRFIPIREFADPPSTPFHMTKSPQKLSPEEKLLRRRSPKEDPFMPTPTRKTASAPITQNVRANNPHYGPHLVNDLAITRARNPRTLNGIREISTGAVWSVGGASAALARPSLAISDGTGGLLGSGTTAPMYNAKFLPRVVTASDHREKHESRIALALDIDPSARLLKTCKLWPLLESRPSPSSPNYEQYSPCVWKDNAWRRVERDHWTTTDTKGDSEQIVPTRPFRILEAPLLRDDFYCSTLAYSSTSGILAVGLGHRVYLWSEDVGVQYPPFSNQHPSNYVMSLSFSSENGGKSILAVGRRAGLLSLWSILDSDVRFEVSHPCGITCVAFKPTKSRKLSERFLGVEVDVEELVVGDDHGNVWYYSVEWPDDEVRDNLDWHGSMTLLAKISAHTQQICGLAWSPDNAYLATGGNDNSCMLFDLREIIPAREFACASGCCSSRQSLRVQCRSAFSCLAANANPRRIFNRRPLISHLLPSWNHSNIKPLSTSLLNHTGSLISGGERTVLVPLNHQKHRLVHSAAVKAIAFAPWQPSLLATGGGSNDRAIHFFHTLSGACLATINVYAQVTSLIWSKTRREIAATFGYAQPDHPFRIAVFAWPSCEQISAIPWGPHGSSWDSFDNATLADCGRALCAVSYPGRSLGSTLHLDDEGSVRVRRGESEPNQYTMGPELVRPRAKEGGVWCSRTVEEGCIIIASSDQSVKFHEVWGGSRKRASAVSGPFGGSEILEGLEGIEKASREIIR